MKKSKLSTMLALTIAFQMVLAPVAIAQSSESTADKIFNYASQGLNMGMGAYNSIRGGAGSMPAYMAQDMAGFQKQQTPLPDKFFTMQNMAKIPGLQEYIAVQNQRAATSGGKPINPAALSCQTLPTTMSEPNNEVCRNRSINQLAGDPAAQRDEAFAYYNQYLQIDKLYENYTKESNVGGQSYGYGCMKDAMEILNGFFAYRSEQLDTVIANMEKATDQFKQQSEADLKSVRESTALLNGSKSPFSTEFKDSDKMNFAKRFADPACNSIFAKDGTEGVATIGKSAGLMGIQDKLEAKFTAVPEGSKYSPEQYIGKDADIISDIQKMADKVSEQATLNFQEIANGQAGYSQFISELKDNVSSDSGANVALNGSFFADLQTKFTKERNTLDNEKQLISSELGSSGQQAMDLLTKIDNDSNFDAEVSTLENTIKSDCLNNSGIDMALSRIYDPNLSTEANKQSSEQLRKRIRVIITDTKLSPDVKKQRLQEIESQNGRRFEMKLDGNYETQTVGQDGGLVKKTVTAASKVTPGDYFGDVINNCESQFQVNKLNNKLSGKEAIQHLRSLKNDYKQAARKHANDIRSEVVKKMIDCNGNSAVANSNGVASCSPEKLNMGSPGFCAKGAFSCAKNMESCTHKAEKFVNEIKDDRLARVTNYNNNVELNRQQLVSMVDRAMGKYMKEAESLRGMFGAGFKAPSDIRRDLKKEDNPFMDKYKGTAGDELEVKDPEKYLEMVKDDITKLQKSVSDQQESIMKTLKDHMEKTKNNYKENVLGKTKTLAQACLDAYNNYAKIMSDQKKGYDDAQGQMGEKNSSLCSKYSQVMSKNPNGACGTFEDVGSDALKAAGKAGGNSADINSMIDEMRARCAGEGVDNSNDICNSSLKDKGELKSMCNIIQNPNNSRTEQHHHCDEKPVEKRYIKTDCLSSAPNNEDEEFKKSSGMKNDEKCEAWTPLTSECTVKDNKKYQSACSPKTITYDCSKLDDKIASEYKKVRGEEFSQPSQSTPVHASCPSNNNSGQFNPKSLIPGMSSQNPLQQNSAGTIAH